MGPVHVAMGVQALVLRCSAGKLNSFGLTKALYPALAVGSVVIGQRTVPHDPAPKPQPYSAIDP